MVSFLWCNAENTTCTRQNVKFSSIRYGRRRYTAPILLYHNHIATFQIILSGDVETNPGPVTCPLCQKTVRKNSLQFCCSVCKDTTHAKCHKSFSKAQTTTQKVMSWTCYRCLCSELPFHGTRNIDDHTSPVEDTGDHVADNHLDILNANRNRISISHLNTQSITSSFAEFEAMLMRYKFDIITLSETWLKDNPHLLNHVTIPGYKTEFNNRDGKRGGGVGLYIKENLQYKRRNDIIQKDKSIEHLWLQVNSEKDSFLLAVFYQPSSVLVDKRMWLQKFESLIAYVNTIWTGPIILTGDTNINLQNKDTGIFKQYSDMLEVLRLKQHVTKATRKGEKLIDHIITNLNKIHHEDVLPCDEISDHDAPYIICSIKKPRFEPRYKYIRIEKNFDAMAFKSDVEKLPFAAVYAMESPEDKLDVFNHLFLSCLNKHAPLIKKKLTRPPAPWLKDFDITRKLHERDRLRQIAHATQDPTAWGNFRKIRNEIKKVIRSAKTTFYKRALSSKRPKEVWNTIHRILHPNPQSIKADPDVLNKHYHSTAQRLLNSKPKSEDVLNDIINTFPDSDNALNFSQVPYSDIRKAILSLRDDCSTGPDTIPSKFLKICIDEITSPLCHIINTSIEEQVFPDQWKVSKISPIPKVDHPKEPSDYRPISILPALSKIYEKILMLQLVSHLDNNQLLSNCQTGFRKGHCTITTCIKIKNDIIKAMDRGEVTLAVMADFSKAFDTVDFEILLKKLHDLNLSKSSLKILVSYLSNRRQYVQINDNESQFLPVTNGVPQGSILGPVLFNIYVYDMSSKTDATCIQYADDTSLYRHSKPRQFDDCVNRIGNDVNDLQGWSKNTNLIFNPMKTKCILFTTPQMAKRHKFKFELKSSDGMQIDRVSNFKLLGVTFSEDMKWNQHVKKATSSAYGSLKTLIHLKRFLPFHLRKQLAEMLVLSRLDYGNALLINAPSYLHNQLQRVQNAAASFVRGRFSRKLEVIGLKWLPIQERVEMSLAKLAWKSVHCEAWPKFLPMKKAEARRPARGVYKEGSLIDCPTNIRGTFEYDASKTFNELPLKCRDSSLYTSFCRETHKHLLDRALARLLE